MCICGRGVHMCHGIYVAHRWPLAPGLAFYLVCDRISWLLQHMPSQLACKLPGILLWLLPSHHRRVEILEVCVWLCRGSGDSISDPNICVSRALFTESSTQAPRIYKKSRPSQGTMHILADKGLYISMLSTSCYLRWILLRKDVLCPQVHLAQHLACYAWMYEMQECV